MRQNFEIRPSLNQQFAPDASLQVPSWNRRLFPSEHTVTHILEVKFTQVDELREVLFLTRYGCPCCLEKQHWNTKENLVQAFGVNEDKLNEIEQQAERDRKDRETRDTQRMIQNFLHFEDIKDFQKSCKEFCEFLTQKEH
jgi:hypothetical protein